MRDILFRGKRIDNGEWVEGYVFDDGFVDSKRMFVGGLVIMDYKGTADDRWDVGTAFYEVSPDTICQYTGLLDKNGNKIWENDIVDTHNRGHGYSRLERVIYENGGFFPISTHGWECEPDADEIEVIGNVFDNKELLEE